MCLYGHVFLTVGSSPTPTVEEESEEEDELNIHSDDEFIVETFEDNEKETQEEISDSNNTFS